MARNASGNYSLPAVYRATPGTTIRSDQHNTPLEDIAQALTDSLPRNGSAPMTGNLSMGGRRITGLGEGTEPTDVLRRDQAILLAGTQAYGRSLLNTASAAAALTLLGAAPAARTVTGGAGLTGGGPLTANQVIAMGTPGGITATSTNATTETSHTHALPAAQFRLMSATHLTAGQIGSMAFAGRIDGQAAVSYGQVVNGSTLRPSNAGGIYGGAELPGRWECLGSTTGVTGQRDSTMWIRVE